VTKGKTARDYPFATSRGRNFCVRLPVGDRYKKSLLSLKGMAWRYCLNVKVTWMLHCAFKLFLPFVSPTGLQIKK